MINLGKGRQFRVAFVAHLSDETLLRKDGCAMTKRKIGMFFVIVMAVFGASRGSNNVRQATASIPQRPTTQPTLGNFDAFDLSAPLH